MSADSITVTVVLKIGDRTVRLSETSPITMSGDRRRHRRQIREYIEERAEFLASRFGASDDR